MIVSKDAKFAFWDMECLVFEGWIGGKGMAAFNRGVKRRKYE
jgi:hypothetical protein